MLRSGESLVEGSGRSGADYFADIAKLSGKAREDKTLEYFRERWLPPSLLAFKQWPKVTLSNDKHTLVVQVSPDFARVGVDEAGAALAGMWPTTAQKAADELGVRTIGKVLAREVFRQSAVKGTLPNPGEPYYDLKNGTPRNIEDSRAWAAADVKRRKWLDAQVPLDKRASTLVAGAAKDVVHQASALSGGSALSGSKLAIYGSAPGKNDGWAIQPFPGPHAWNYGPDYSHGVRFARKRAVLDGQVVSLDDVASSLDPSISSLLSEAGPYNNRMSSPPSGLSIEGFPDLADLEEVYVPTGRVSDLGEAAVVDGAGPEPEPPTARSLLSYLFWPWGPIGLLSTAMVWGAQRGAGLRDRNT